MRTLAGIAIGLTASILAYTLRKPACRRVFNPNEEVPDPDNWAPKVRVYHRGQLVIDLEAYKPAMVNAWTPR